ncbi:homocysteine S-methyltransferase family protein [Roseivivax sp. CAU 1761]
MDITILDGGVGQELVKRSPEPPTPLWSTKAMLDAPELLRGVHDDFFAAGAEIAIANTYAVHHDRLVAAGLDARFEELHRRALDIALASRDAHGSGRVAASLGPLGWSYRPDMAPPEAEAARAYAEIAALHEGRADLFLAETMASVAQARGALMGLAGAAEPIWLAVTPDDGDGGRLRSGEAVTEILALVDEFRPAMLLVNCARPEAVTTALEALRHQGVPLGAYANGFTGIAEAFRSSTATVRELAAREDLSPARYADFAERWAELGATVIGGCCEVGPAHIAELARRLNG